MPGRELLGRIVEEFDLDPQETLMLFTREDPEEFGEYLRAKVFKSDEYGEPTVEADTADNEEEDASADTDAA